MNNFGQGLDVELETEFETDNEIHVRKHHMNLLNMHLFKNYREKHQLHMDNDDVLKHIIGNLYERVLQKKVEFEEYRVHYDNFLIANLTSDKGKIVIKLNVKTEEVSIMENTTEISESIIKDEIKIAIELHEI